MDKTIEVTITLGTIIVFAVEIFVLMFAAYNIGWIRGALWTAKEATGMTAREMYRLRKEKVK